MKRKSLGQRAYEAEVAERPYYVAAPHIKRPAWSELNEQARQAWDARYGDA